MKINAAEQELGVGANYGQSRAQSAEGEEKQRKKDGKSIKASELNLPKDPIEEKKKKAQRDAMDFIKKQFASDSAVDEMMEECREWIASGKEDAQAASKELQAIAEQKEQLKEAYPDQSDETYKEMAKDLADRESHWREELQNAQAAVTGSTKAIRSMKQAVLGKLYDMGDAEDAKEKELEAASKEVVGMLLKEATDHVDEKLDEAVEKAGEAQEKKQEKEEELEEAQAERKKQEQEAKEQLEQKRAQGARAQGPELPDMESLLDKQPAIVQNMKEILEEQKLLEEEIKGIVVDLNL